MTPAGRRALSVALWASAALVLAWSLVRTFGLERGFPLVPILAWTPFAIPPAIAIVTVAALARRWAPAMIALLATVLLIAAVVPRAFGGGHDGSDPNGSELRVMAANLKLGKADPAAVVELVREGEIDVLCVQELTARMASALQREGLGELLEHRVGGSAPSSSGSAIFSRYGLRVRPDANPPGYPFRMPRAAVRIPGAAPLEIASVHPVPPTDPDATSEWQAGLEALPATTEDGARGRDGGALTVLAGDFNATLDHAALRDVLDRGYVDAADATGNGLTPTWPQGVFRPPVTIDHVLADERIGIDAYEVHDLAGSDHRAVSATLTLPAGPRG